MDPARLKEVVALSKEDMKTLVEQGSVVIQGELVTLDPNTLYLSPDSEFGYAELVPNAMLGYATIKKSNVPVIDCTHWVIPMSEVLSTEGKDRGQIILPKSVDLPGWTLTGIVINGNNVIPCFDNFPTHFLVYLFDPSADITKLYGGLTDSTTVTIYSNGSELIPKI